MCVSVCEQKTDGEGISLNRYSAGHTDEETLQLDDALSSQSV